MVRQNLAANQVLASTPELSGPVLSDCLTILGGQATGFHDKRERNPMISKYKLAALPNLEVDLLPNQVTGLVWLVNKSYGFHDALRELREAKSEPEKVKAMKANLREFPITGGGLLVDQMGLGKTKTMLAFLSYTFTVRFEELKRQGHNVWRPTLVVVPAGLVVEQWRQDIMDNFPDIELVLAYGNSAPEGLAANFLSRQDQCLLGHHAFPKRLKWLFDHTQERAYKTVVLTSYETFTERTLDSDSDATPRRKRGKKVKGKSSQYKDMFSMAIFDEGHRLKKRGTARHMAAKLVNAEYNFFITGTPVTNAPEVSRARTYCNRLTDHSRIYLAHWTSSGQGLGPCTNMNQTGSNT